MQTKTTSEGTNKLTSLASVAEERMAGWKHWKAINYNKLFIYTKILQSRLFPKQKMKILFSNKKDWEQTLKNGFKHTNHEITFGDFATKNILDYDLVVPLTIPALKYLTNIRDLISDNPIPIPSMESIQLCDDKYFFNQSLIKNGFKDNIPEIRKQQTYPYILKKRIDVWGKNSYIITDSEHEENFRDELLDPDYFTQEFIFGAHEYATHIHFKNQKIDWSLNIEYWFKTDTPIKGKDKPEYRKICRCPYLQLFSSILSFISFEGLCCFNYKVKDNQPLILEINPRFGGSLCPYFFSLV